MQENNNRGADQGQKMVDACLRSATKAPLCGLEEKLHEVPHHDFHHLLSFLVKFSFFPCFRSNLEK